MTHHPPAPVPTGEERRLELLRRFEVLDSPPERTFDDIAFEAAALCETPMGLVSLIDEQRAWVKAAYGMERGELPRDVAFCSHAMCEDRLLLVPDATRDDRFRENMLVVDAPYVRAYAGAPVFVDGQRFGTVAVVDLRPRAFSDEQLEDLEALARLAGDQFELRRRGQELSKTLRRLRTLQGLLPICDTCGQVRDEGAWRPLDSYLAAHTGAVVSHGLCPECLPKYLPAEGGPRGDN